MTKEQAVLAAETLEDVFTPEGDAVTLTAVSLTGPCRALVNGENHYEEWFDVGSLTLSRFSPQSR